MRVTICIPAAQLRAQLAQLMARYQEQRSVEIHLRVYENEIDFLCDVTPGGEDVIFFSSDHPNDLIAEIRQTDKQVRFVRVTDDGASWNAELWYCLPEPLGEGFLFPVLDRLAREVNQDAHTGILVKNRGSVTHLTLSAIEYVETMGRKVFFHATDGKLTEATGSFAEYEQQLLQWPDFIKIHRSYLVNLRHVVQLEASGVVVRGGANLPVSRKLYPEIRKDYLCRLSDPGAVAAAPPKPVHTQERYRVLLVDDEPDALAHWGWLLETHGCEAVCAADGKTALALAAQGRFHCVLLDVLLGEETGFSLCRSLHELTAAPVVFLSCCVDPASQLEGFAAGGIDYITKDTPDELSWAKIDARIRLSKSEREELRFGPLCISLTDRRAAVGSCELMLTAVEFDLLCLLAGQPETLFTPAEIYRALWGEEPDGDGQAVQLQMSRLRRKLERVGAEHEFIKTVWGEGYRFCPTD